MPRKLRLEYEGAIYHVMNRGDRQEPVFLDDEDRRLYLETLGETCRKTDWQNPANNFEYYIATGAVPHTNHWNDWGEYPSKYLEPGHPA